MERTNSRFAYLGRETASTAGAAALVMLFGGILLLCDPNYYWRDDYQLNYLPKFQEIARSLRQGEFPLLIPSTWQAGDMGGEYQFGIFSIWSLFCVGAGFSLGLSLPLTAAILSLVHLGLLAAGAFRLARRRNLGGPESTLVAITASMNGWVLVWGAMNWFVALAGLAWLPWVWWSLERALASPRPARAAVLAGGFIYLAVTAGWHFAILMIGVLTIWLAIRSIAAGRRRTAIWPLSAAWIVGLGLSAPAWLMILEYSPFTERGQTSIRQLSWDWTVPLAALPGLIFPAHVSNWAVFDWAWRPHRCVELAGAFVPLAVSAAAFSRFGLSWFRHIAWELALAALALSLAMLPSAGNLRWSFRWLPLFFLTLGLMAGHGLAMLQRLPSRGSLSGPAPWAIGLSVGSLLFIRAGHSDPTPYGSLYGLVVLAICLLWTLLQERVPRMRPWMPCLVGLASLGCLYAFPITFIEVPSWEVRVQSSSGQQLPADTRYLSICSYNDFFSTGKKKPVIDFYPGNCCLYDGYEFLNGYSPLRLIALTTLFGFQTHGVLSREAGERILLRETGQQGLLELLGVDGLVVPHDFASFLPTLEESGWVITAHRQGSTVLHRRSLPSPRVRVVERVQWGGDVDTVFAQLLQHRDSPIPLVLAGSPPFPGADASLGKADLCVLGEDRSSIRLHVRTESSKAGSLVVVSRPWYPGYVASFNGEPIPLYRLNQVIPAVLLPAGVEGLLVLEYRPRSLTLGLIICLTTLLACAGVVLPLRRLNFTLLRSVHTQLEQPLT